MRDLGQQVVNHVCANAVLDSVEHSVVTVQCGESTTQVTPLLCQETYLSSVLIIPIGNIKMLLNELCRN